MDVDGKNKKNVQNKRKVLREKMAEEHLLPKEERENFSGRKEVRDET